MATVSAFTLAATRFQSTQVTGVSPLVVASTTVVANLNADLLDGQEGSHYLDLANATGTLDSARVSGSYTGITGVGTLAAGTWNATAITEAYGGTGQTTWTLGDIPYSDAANSLGKLSGNTTTTKKFLSQTGTGTVSAAPAWAALAATDIGSGTFADARISESSVTQHEDALSIAYSQLSDSSAVLDAVQAVTALGTASQVLRMNSGATALEFATIVADAFASVKNSAGTEQFAASGADALQFAAGNDLSVAFDADNNRITFAYTGASGGGMTGLAVKDDGTTIGTRTGINLHAGTGVTLTIADDSANSEVDITIAASTVGSIDDLSDVTITSAATGDLLRHNGSAWVNFAESSLSIAWSQITSTPTTLSDYGITDAVAETNTAAASAVVLATKVTGDGFNRVQILTDSIKLGDGTAPPQSSISYSDGAVQLDKPLKLGDTLEVTGASTVAAITASGLITATGGQIKFPATQVPSSDPNTLDDYEEGTWTPTLSGASTAGTYSIDAGTSARYVKVGSMVTVTFEGTVTATAAGSGSALFGGLPFTKPSGGAFVGTVRTVGVDLPTGTVSLAVIPTSTGVTTAFAIQAMVDNASDVTITADQIATGDKVAVTITYFV